MWLHALVRPLNRYLKLSAIISVMKFHKHIAALMAVFLGVVPSSHAYVVPVFDAASFAQLITMYDQNTTMIGKLGGILGVNNQQLSTLNQMRTAIGSVQNISGRDPSSLTSRQLQALTNGFGLSDSGQVSRLYQSSGPFSGALDAFMGVSINDFRNNQGGPLSALSRSLVNASIASIGGQVGLTSPEIAFTQQVASMDENTRSRNKVGIATGLANLTVDRFYQAAEQRRLQMQAEANIAQQAATRAANSTSLNETAAANAEIAAANARLQAAAAVQTNEANETLIIQADRSNQVLESMDERRQRESLERLMQERNSDRVY